MILFRKANTLFKILREKWYRFRLRRRLTNPDFTILSNNCWGGGIYEDLGLPYTTPTVGLFFHGPCYTRFLSDLKSYIAADLEFIEHSKYAIANEKRKTSNHYYPIGLLKDIEIHFLHYHSRDEAITKWERRKKRINYNNLFIELGENELVDHTVMLHFESLPYQNKLIFTTQEHPDLKSAICLKDKKGAKDIGDIYTHKEVYRKEFDVINWLNNGVKKEAK